MYAQMIAGCDAPTHGETKNSWLTGTAAWNFVAASQWILGIRPTFDGLMDQPVLPSSWDGFQTTCVFRGVTYNIKVTRKGHSNDLHMVVAGKLVENLVITGIPTEASPVQVEIMVGSKN